MSDFDLAGLLYNGGSLMCFLFFGVCMKPVVSERIPSMPDVIIQRVWFIPVVKIAETTVKIKNATDNVYSV